MPRGVVEARTVQCRGCGLDFVTDRPGKASWYCDRCKEERAPRTRRVSPPAPRPPLKPGPLEEDLEVVLRMAEEFGANPRVLREAVQAIAKGDGDQRYWYRRLAAASLALAAYVGGRSV